MRINPDYLVDSGFVDPKLSMILNFIEDRTGLDFMTTSQHRPGDPGVHGQLPLRGWDLRCWDKTIGERLCELVNGTFSYDPSRPSKVCAIYHDAGSGSHIHVQVHPNTEEI